MERKTSDLLDSLLGSWGILGRASSIIKGLLWILIIIGIVLSMFLCFIKFIKRAVGEAFLISKKGGDVAFQESMKDAMVQRPWE